MDVAHGVIDPDFKTEIVRTLETLFRKGADVNPAQIRQQIIRMDWNPEVANEVNRLAEMIWEDRRPKGATGKADEALWQEWNRKANGKDA